MVVCFRAVALEMTGSTTSITGVTGPNIDVVVTIGAIVVDVVVFRLLVLLRLSSLVSCSVTLSVATCTMHLSAFSVMLEIAFAALG